jgi:hypothetical protein
MYCKCWSFCHDHAVIIDVQDAVAVFSSRIMLLQVMTSPRSLTTTQLSLFMIDNKDADANLFMDEVALVIFAEDYVSVLSGCLCGCHG